MSTSASAVNQLLALAKDHFGEDFDSEGTGVDTKFFTAAADGSYADYSDPKGGKNAKDPAKAKDWGPERVIQADRIEWLCTNAEAAALVSQKGIRVLSARIDGKLDLSFVHFDRLITFASCAFDLRPDFGDASFDALYVIGTHCPGISLHRLQLKGNLFLRNGFVSKGKVDLMGASVGGLLDCSGGSFLPEDEEPALSAAGITVTGDLLLRRNFKATGEVDLRRASIGGRLDCSGGAFLNEKGTALSANAITVTGDVLLRGRKAQGGAEQRPKIQVEGRIDLGRANIQGIFHYRDVEEPEKVKLDLRHAKAGVLWDNPKSWPDPGNLWLRGFEYDALGDESAVEASQRIDWLSRDAREDEDFSPQPYEQLAKVLSRSGHRDEARAIHVKKERLLAELVPYTHPDRWWTKITGQGRWWWNLFFGSLTAFGYRPWKVLPWSILIVVVGLPLYEVGYAQGWITPTRVESEVAPYNEGGTVYPTFQGLAYSIDAFVPLVNIEQVDYWLPNAARGPRWDWPGGYYVSCSGVLLFFYYCQVVSGWVLTTLLVVGLTRLVQRED